MAKKAKGATAAATAEEPKGAGKKGTAAALPSVESADSGVPMHSFEATRGPIESKASDPRKAFDVAETEATETKGKPVHIRSRVPTYTERTARRTFNRDDSTVYFDNDFTPEQWKAIKSNPNLVVSKATASEE